MALHGSRPVVSLPPVLLVGDAAPTFLTSDDQATRYAKFGRNSPQARYARFRRRPLRYLHAPRPTRRESRPYWGGRRYLAYPGAARRPSARDQGHGDHAGLAGRGPRAPRRDHAVDERTRRAAPRDRGDSQEGPLRLPGAAKARGQPVEHRRVRLWSSGLQ